MAALLSARTFYPANFYYLLKVARKSIAFGRLASSLLVYPLNKPKALLVVQGLDAVIAIIVC
jgi:hypothetical protein